MPPCAAVPSPRLPDGVRAVFGHEQPAGHLLVFKQAVGVFNIYIRQNAQYQRSREESRAEPPRVVVEGFYEPLFRVFRLLFVQQTDIKRAHKLRLAIGIEREFFRGDERAVALLALAAFFS